MPVSTLIRSSALLLLLGPVLRVSSQSLPDSSGSEDSPIVITAAAYRSPGLSGAVRPAGAAASTPVQTGPATNSARSVSTRAKSGSRFAQPAFAGQAEAVRVSSAPGGPAQTVFAQASVTLTNPLDIDRPDELIVWTRAGLERKLGPIPAGKYIQVSHDSNVPVVVQFDDLNGDHNWDEASFVRSFHPGEKIVLQVAVTDAPAAVKALVRAHVRMRAKNEDDTFGPDLDSVTMPLRNPPTDFSHHKLPPWLTEGPAWENDKVAYRLYFDTRNGKDIYGKTTTRMVMDQVGADPAISYHELADWGMDILKVGNSLGAGALALSVPVTGKKDTLIRLGGQNIRKEKYERIADGPVRAIFRLYYEWEIDGRPVQITEETRISAGQYFYESRVTVHGAPSGARLVTGIANFYSNEPGHFSKAGAEVLFSYGRQSENKDLLGMGILAGKRDFSAFVSRPASGSEVTSTYTVSQEIRKERPVAFRFYTCWERTDPGFGSVEYFRALLGREAEKFSHPVQEKW